MLICLIAFIDSKLKWFWGKDNSELNALLLLFTILSFLYQVALVLHFPLLFSLIDIACVLLCLVFFKPILIQLKEYGTQLFIQPWKNGERFLYILYPFLAYLFCLSIFAVPGMNWDSMIYHLTRPFLYLNEGSIFTPHYSDGRQVAWPLGADVLTYIFTRHEGNTLGVGFLQYIFYIGIILAVYKTALYQTNSKIATTIALIAASLPVIVYGATTVKNDLSTAFAFLMLWISFDRFHRRRSRSDLFLIFLAMAFGLSCKVTFLILGSLSVLTFIVVEKRNGTLLKPLTGPRFSLLLLLALIPCFIFLTQIHLYIHNIITHGDFGGDHVTTTMCSQTWETFTWTSFIQDVVKYQLVLFDFVLPLSIVNIPFIDTLISFFYNHTIGALTGDKIWHYHYFPEEMRASFGPFGILILWAIYKTFFTKPKAIAFALTFISMFMFLFVAYKVIFVPVAGLRYLAPTFITSLVFLPAFFQSRILLWRKTICVCCTFLLLFCCLFNYEKPLLSLHPKMIPWYRYAFSDRSFLYHKKYFLDDRMDIYYSLLKPGNKVFVFSSISGWAFPYYQYKNKANVRLGNYESGKKVWFQVDFQDYNLIVCNTPQCIQDFDQRKGFEKVWETESTSKVAAFYQPIVKRSSL